MDKISRVKMALAHKEPDKVPKGEIGTAVAEHIKRGLLGERYVSDASKFSGSYAVALNENNLNIRELLHFDLVNCEPAAPPLVDLKVDYHGYPLYRDAWGGETCFPTDAAQKIVKPTMQNLDEAKSYQFPDPSDFYMGDLKDWLKKTDYYVFGLIQGVFFMSYWELFPFLDFLVWCGSEKKKVKYWAEKCADFYRELALIQVDVGIHGLIYADDLAFNSGPFISPQLFRELFYEPIKGIVEVVKSRDVPVIIHCDGYLPDEMINILIDIGFDGWQAVQMSAGNDIAQIKKKFGDKLTLFGNIDIDTLGRGSQKDVEEEVKHVIKAAASGGGFILSSSNELGPETSPENALAMYEAAEKFGKYPINIP
ncbi:MAG: hypothetical protein M1371_03295 [Actinobacteria bacterium]|nr:hypothetical protein [Actinomycetota bacterium]